MSDILDILNPPTQEEIFTPVEVVNKILDLLPLEVWSNKNLKFLNPCCKSGGFLREVAKRLMIGLREEILDRDERKVHILNNMIYGIAISEFMIMTTRRTLYGEKEIKGNIYLRDDFNLPWELKNMKFDIIIGNPPYQELIGGGSGNLGSNAMAVYHKFIEQAKQLAPKYITMIIPAKWYNGIKVLDKFRDDFINDLRIRELHDFVNSEDCFPKNVALGGGVCYFLWDSNYNGECNFYEHKKDQTGNDNIICNKRFLKSDYSEGIIRYNSAISILNKIKLEQDNSFRNLVTSQQPFGLKSNFEHFTYESDENSIKLIMNKGNRDKDKKNNDTYVDLKYITKHRELINKYKIFISVAYGCGIGGEGPFRVLNKNFIIGEPKVVCTQTYLAIGGFNSLEETNSVISYMKTKFFRFLVMMRVVDKLFSPNYFSLIPIQNWNEQWNDEKLYEKYNLIQEEIDFIENMITKLE